MQVGGDTVGGIDNPAAVVGVDGIGEIWEFSAGLNEGFPHVPGPNTAGVMIGVALHGFGGREAVVKNDHAVRGKVVQGVEDITEDLVVFVEAVDKDDIVRVLTGCEEGVGCHVMGGGGGWIGIDGGDGIGVDVPEGDAGIGTDLKEGMEAAPGDEGIDEIVAGDMVEWERVIRSVSEDLCP